MVGRKANGRLVAAAKTVLVLAVHDQSTARCSAQSLSSNPESEPANDYATAFVSVRIVSLEQRIVP